MDLNQKLKNDFINRGGMNALDDETKTRIILTYPNEFIAAIDNKIGDMDREEWITQLIKDNLK